MLSITPTEWRIRGGKTHTRYGEAYKWVGTLSKQGNVGWLEGFCGVEFLPSDRKAIEKFCAEHGMPTVFWEQIKDGMVTEKEWRMPRSDVYTVRFLGFEVLKNGEAHHKAGELVYDNMDKEHMVELQQAVLDMFGKLNAASVK